MIWHEQTSKKTAHYISTSTVGTFAQVQAVETLATSNVCPWTITQPLLAPVRPRIPRTHVIPEFLLLKAPFQCITGNISRVRRVSLKALSTLVYQKRAYSSELQRHRSGRDVGRMDTEFSKTAGPKPVQIGLYAVEMLTANLTSSRLLNVVAVGNRELFTVQCLGITPSWTFWVE